ncbi:MAG: tRNA lysidine(34) synthetase TilS [Armatimonadota bacterium]
MSNTFLDTVRKTITRNDMIRHGDRIIVAVSGGADSVALLHVLWTMKDEFNLDLIAAHMNHGIRGEDADRDALFVQELAARLKIASVVEKVDVPAFRKKARLGLEEAARKVRYDFLESIASDAGAARVAVAHTADDQVETVLLNIIRGTGPDGVSGMPEVRGRIIRPLIDTFRADVEAYLHENGLDWATDVTNLALDYTRNRVRLQLIPFLEDKFNPRVKDALLSLSRLVRDENEAIKAATELEFAAAAKEAGYESVVLDASRLRNLPLALLRRCIRKAVELVKGDLRDVEYIQTERIADSIIAKEDVALTLPSGKVYARFTGDELRIFRIVEPAKFDIEKELEIGGRTEVPELGVLFETKFVPANIRPEKPSQAVINPKKIKGKLILRTWRRGDRILPLGMTGHKKLQDLFTDAKTPRRERGLVPVITDDEKIIWVAGYTISELVRITEKTCTALWMEYFHL